ncbi:MAG: hypothetical protein KAT04_06685 [Methylococcales bacterium]|nr:hypothetical protein [Methylococcales bacterium]
MGNAQKLMLAVVGVFVVGFIMVGSNKEQSKEKKEAAAMIRAIAGMQAMAHQKCPMLIKQHTGSAIRSLVSDTKTNKSTYYTVEWLGEKDDNFKKATCTITSTLGGVSKLVIDGKVIIDKE